MPITEKEEVDEPREILNLGYQMLIGALSVLFSVPFGSTFPLSYYEQESGANSGDWWYVGLIFILGTYTLMFMFYYTRGKEIYVSFIKSFISLVFIFSFSVIINSLWQYGKFINFEYFQSYRYFLTSDIVISMSSGLAVIGISVFIPQQTSKHTNLWDFCDAETKICYIPTSEGLKKINLPDDL